MNKDRLYELLPAIYRIRDVEQGEPLRALLQVIGEQVDLVEEDIGRLYENLFIETCEDWVVPYIADLVGYRPVHEAGEPGPIESDQGTARNKILIPRREVANTIRYRRRKGALALLELLANDIAGWPARAVEFYRLLGWNQPINHLHMERGRTVDLRDMRGLADLDGPFDRLAHMVDVRRVVSNLTVGRFNIPSVGVYLWRLGSYKVTQTPACCVDAEGPHCFTFSVLGNDAPLFLAPEPETDPTHIADEFNLPVPLRRATLERNLERLYGEDKSLFLWTGVKRGRAVALEPVPANKLVAADLSDWIYTPRRGTVAIDPELGRIAFPARHPPKYGVWVSYRYGFSADLGGGQYRRRLSQPESAEIYRVAQTGEFDTLGQALDHWRSREPAHAVIEIEDNRVYVEPIRIEFAEGQKSLQLRAANGARPVIRLLDWQTSQFDALTVIGSQGERFEMDGLLVAGRGVQLSGDLKKVMIRHCTLVPGWTLDNNCRPERPSEPSLEVLSPRACVVIEHSVLGTIQINPIPAMPEDDTQEYPEAPESSLQKARCQGVGPDFRLDPIRLCVSDTILDATSPDQEAIGSPGCPVGHAILSISRCTVFGQIQTHSIELGENCIFEGRVTVARRQHGCLRFCYVSPGSRTPPRFQCQPDLVESAVEGRLRLENGGSGLEERIEAAKAFERMRVRPQFNSAFYGRPDYCQLAVHCAAEIKRGADDESEMGAFHDLFQPQREANLRVRLDEHVPAGCDVGMIFVT